MRPITTLYISFKSLKFSQTLNEFKNVDFAEGVSNNFWGGVRKYRMDGSIFNTILTRQPKYRLDGRGCKIQKHPFSSRKYRIVRCAAQSMVQIINRTEKGSKIQNLILYSSRKYTTTNNANPMTPSKIQSAIILSSYSLENIESIRSSRSRLR